MKVFLASRVRKSALRELLFIKSFDNVEFLDLAKSNLLNLAKFDFLDLVEFAIVNRFLITPSSTPPPTLLPAT